VLHVCTELSTIEKGYSRSSGSGFQQMTLLMIESLQERFILSNKVDKFHNGTTLWRTREGLFIYTTPFKRTKRDNGALKEARPKR